MFFSSLFEILQVYLSTIQGQDLLYKIPMLLEASHLESLKQNQVTCLRTSIPNYYTYSPPPWKCCKEVTKMTRNALQHKYYPREDSVLPRSA